MEIFKWHLWKLGFTVSLTFETVNQGNLRLTCHTKDYLFRYRFISSEINFETKPTHFRGSTLLLHHGYNADNDFTEMLENVYNATRILTKKKLARLRQPKPPKCIGFVKTFLWNKSVWMITFFLIKYIFIVFLHKQHKQCATHVRI